MITKRIADCVDRPDNMYICYSPAYDQDGGEYLDIGFDIDWRGTNTIVNVHIPENESRLAYYACLNRSEQNTFSRPITEENFLEIMNTIRRFIDNG